MQAQCLGTYHLIKMYRPAGIRRHGGVCLVCHDVLSESGVLHMELSLPVLLFQVRFQAARRAMNSFKSNPNYEVHQKGHCTPFQPCTTPGLPGSLAKDCERRSGHLHDQNLTHQDFSIIGHNCFSRISPGFVHIFPGTKTTVSANFSVPGPTVGRGGAPRDEAQARLWGSRFRGGW